MTAMREPLFSACWTRMTGVVADGHATARRVVYCTHDPRADPAMLASLQASLRRYCGDELGVPESERTPAWERGFAWTFDELRGDESPFRGLGEGC